MYKIMTPGPTQVAENVVSPAAENAPILISMQAS